MYLICELSDSKVLENLTSDQKQMIIKNAIKQIFFEPLVYIGFIIFCLVSSLGLYAQFIFWDNSSIVMELIGLFIFGFPASYLGIIFFSHILEIAMRPLLLAWRKRLIG